MRETLDARDCANYDRENKLVKFILESGPFERLHSLVGFEEAMVSMYTEPEAFLDDFILLRYGQMLLHAPVAYVTQGKGTTLDAFFREEFRC